MRFRIDRGQVVPVSGDKKNQPVQRAPGQDFQAMLQETIKRGQEIKISAHAQQRMEERNIRLEEGDMKALQGAMDSLEKKGARESLMLYKDFAFIASIRNRTIITSMGTNEVDVVTNIDSAIIVNE